MVQVIAGAQQHTQQRHDHRDEGDQQRRKGAVQDQERQIHTGGVIDIVYHILVQRDEIRQAVEQPRDGQKQQGEPVGGDTGALDDVLRLSLQGNTVKQHSAALLSARGLYTFLPRRGNILSQCRRKHKCRSHRQKRRNSTDMGIYGSRRG